MSMEQHIQISILMPIYKVEQYIEKTLDSIFTQTYPYLDYVFVNDCSPDKSILVLKDTIKKHHIEADRYTIIDHVQNEGIAVSRADCIAYAKGDYEKEMESDGEGFEKWDIKKFDCFSNYLYISIMSLILFLLL